MAAPIGLAIFKEAFKDFEDQYHHLNLPPVHRRS